MSLNFQKYADGLVPAIIQDSETRQVLMLGFMNAEALEKTKATGQVTFYSRSRQTLWTKGETGGNFLAVEKILVDCDDDTILIKAHPSGPVCHTGSDTCFDEANEHADFLFTLERIIRDRQENPTDESYTSKLFAAGLNRIAQKVGEEAVELVIEAKDSDKDRFNAEAADLLYHLLVLFVEKGIQLSEVLGTLEMRMKRSKPSTDKK
jgi:phosphoribosyl-ATP pyrophosphohydrolase/phosphoribosyl-AMP cyclohydrolase